MKKRVTFGAKDKRRDQRRPVSIEGSIGGVRVDLLDVSFAGVGGGTMALGDAAGLDLQEGQDTTLEFTGPDGQHVRLSVKIQRIDHDTGKFGAAFTELSDKDFDVIEKLMFPHRANAPAKAKA